MTLTTSTRFLLIDHQRSAVQALTSIIRQFGCYDISSDPSLQKAFFTYKKIKPDVVICEHNLPDGTGIDLCNRIREYELGSNDPDDVFSGDLDKIHSSGKEPQNTDGRTLFLLVTPRPTKQMVALARQSSVDAIAVKPLSTPVLKAKFQQLMSRRPPRTAA